MCWFGDPLLSKACRVGALIKLPLSQVRSDHSYFLEAFPVGEGLKALLQFAVLLFSELTSSLDGGLDGSELECSSSSICAEDKLSPSFCLPLDFLGGVLSFGFFFLSSSNYESICLRVSIDSCWVRIISSCSLWTWA